MNLQRKSSLIFQTMWQYQTKKNDRIQWKFESLNLKIKSLSHRQVCSKEKYGTSNQLHRFSFLAS